MSKWISTGGLLCGLLLVAVARGYGAPAVVGGDDFRRAVETDRAVRVLIKLKEDADPPGLSRSAGARLPGARIDRAAIRRLQDRLETSFTPAERTTLIRIRRRLENIPWLSAELAGGALARLSRLPFVEALVEDVPVRASLAQSGPLTGAGIAGAAGIDGGGVAVAVLDTGIDANHPDLASSLLHEECFATGNKCPGGTSRASGPGSARDDNGHGTHVAGIITADHASWRGIAPAAGVVAVKVLDATGNGWSSDIIAALDWTAGNHAAYNIRVVNLSLGYGLYPAVCDSSQPAFAAAAQAAAEAGIAVFAAAGNDAAANGIAVPACLAPVISVGSVYDANIGGLSWGVCTDNATAADRISCFSDVAPFLDLLAPGALIYASARGGGHEHRGGTSMASPHAAAAAALLLQGAPSLQPEEIRTLLRSTGTPLHDDRVNLDFPRLDSGAALRTVAADLAATVTVSPDPVGNAGSWEYTVTLANGGPGSALAATLDAGIPAVLDLLAAQPSQGVCAVTAAALHCDLGTVGSGATVAVTVRAAAVEQLATVPFTVQVAAANPDPLPADNSASVVRLSDRQPPVVAVTPAGGVYGAPQRVTLSCDDGGGYGCAALRYTIDGGPPTTASSRYTGPFRIAGDLTLRAAAEDGAGNLSPIRTETYAIATSSGSAASFLHPPHDTIGCDRCHLHPFDSWPGYAPDPANGDDTIRNFLCLGCHGPGAATVMQPHSSRGSGGAPVWTTQCVDCHDPHFQAQLQWRGSDGEPLQLVTGTILSLAASGTNTLVRYTLAGTAADWQQPAGWADGKGAAGRGLILVADPAGQAQPREILAAAGQTVLVRGGMSALNAGKPFAIVYGQLIRDRVRTPAGEVRPVRFIDRRSGWVDTSATGVPTGLCQVCHTATAYWKRDGSSVSHPESDCAGCHAPARGFAP
ncbi:MAG: S8 family serine peptidase [Thermodesulfobacteriota bacterium]